MSLPSKAMRSVRALGVPCPRRSHGPVNNGKDFHTWLCLSMHGSCKNTPKATVGLEMTAEQTPKKLRTDAMEILGACLEASDPEEAVKRSLRVDKGRILFGEGLSLDLADFDRIFVVGAGKGSAAMGKAVEEILGDRVNGGIICVKYDHGLPLKRIRIREAGHPVPDAHGEQAAREIVDLLKSMDRKDLVISCISGGGSALLPAPAAPITLDEKQSLTRDLLAVGANIREINAIRKHISLTKGGNLMAAAYPALVINLMLSDVVGDDPGTIASGPFVADESTFTAALKVLDQYGLIQSCPETIVRRLTEGADQRIPETPKRSDPIFERVRSVIVGSNIVSLNAGRKKARELGYRTLILSSSIEGDTTEAALFHGAVAAEIRAEGNPIPPPACVLSGGETTVIVKGKGKGGRNQEFALSLVKRASRIPRCSFLSAGTDGTDGPTDAAGAIVDSRTLERATAKGLDPEEFLRNNDAYHFFQKLDDLIITGPTLTNVMDVRLMLLDT